jgi:hypothetical protein
MADRCIPCEEHAELHKGNPGFGPMNEPCAQCEEHARMHSAEGCGGLFLVLAATVAVVGAAVGSRRGT